MKRQKYIDQINNQFDVHRACGLLGPRQCGKTTLAKEFVRLHEIPKNNYFDLENPIDLERLQNPVLTFEALQGYIVIDEIQRRPDLFPVLRYIIDNSNLKFLILGSASRELIKQSSETLAGRIGYIEIKPFDALETMEIQHLWFRGGFPLSYLAQTDAASFEWRMQYIQTFLERDIFNLGFSIPAAQLRRFWMMLTHYHGQIFNASEIGQALGVSHHTVQHYLSILEGTFMIRVLRPWFENLKKRQVKSPKIYFRDSGLYHALMGIRSPEDIQVNPRIGASWEGFALEEIITYFDVRPEDCYFWSTHSVAEIDLLLFKDGKRIGIDFKYGDVPSRPKTMNRIIEDLRLDEVKLVYPGDKRYFVSDKVEALGLKTLLD